MTVSATDVAALRAFNRTWTATAGLLQAGLLDTPYSLTEARVLFELAEGGTVDVADLRRALGLDSGYLSRIVQRFRADGLVSTEPSPDDGRRQVARLTSRGREVFAHLDQRSAAQVEDLLSGFDDESRTEVVAAMATVTAAFAPPGAGRTEAGLVLRDPGPGDLGWIVGAHGALYAREHGWDRSFEALVARIVADLVDDDDPARDRIWIAERRGRRVGCVVCVHGDDAATAQLRLLLVDPAARGLGLGARLVDECVAFARSTGARTLALWTNDVLVVARRIYQAAGFVLVDEEPHHSFGHDLVGQTWELDLTA